MASLMARLEDDSDDRDDALEKKVEEEDGGCAAEEPIEHQEYLSPNGGRSGHSKP